MVAMGNERDVEVYIFEARNDDAIVVQIDTGERTGRLRVRVNDGAIWDGDPEKVSNHLYKFFYRVSALESAAMQLALDLGELRADISQKIQSRGGVI